MMGARLLHACTLTHTHTHTHTLLSLLLAVAQCRQAFAHRHPPHAHILIPPAACGPCRRAFAVRAGGGHQNAWDRLADAKPWSWVLVELYAGLSVLWLLAEALLHLP